MPVLKQLADTKHEKEKIEEKLRKLERTVVNKKTIAGSVVPPHTTSDHAAKNENFTEKRTLLWVYTSIP